MIDSSAIERLRPIGLNPALIQQLAATAADKEDTDPATVLLRVVEVQREGLTLHDGVSEHPGRLLPALRNALAARATPLPSATGCWPGATRLANGGRTHRVPPLNQLARRLHDGRDKVTRVVIVSNVDTALLVMGLDHDFNLRRLERFVALVRMAHVAPVVVLTKADLCDDVPARVARGAGAAAGAVGSGGGQCAQRRRVHRAGALAAAPARRWCCWAPAAPARAR